VSRVTAKDSGVNTWPAPSPDGKLVVFAADTSELGQGSTDLYVIPLEGGKSKDLTGDMPDSSEIAPDWSPDGAQIAFQVTPDGSNNSDIYVMNADGSEKVKLVSGQGDNIRPHWSPDGKYIAFSSNRTSKYEIFVIEVATKTIYQVTETPRTTICTFWGVE
jgi:TolB protein